MSQFTFTHKTAVVTGGAGGIGQAVAAKLAEKGAHLALIDRNADGLKVVTDRLTAQYPKLKITYYALDLSRLDGVPGVVEKIIADHPKVGLLVNNAGIALNGTIEEISLENFELVLTINFRSQVALVKALLPALKKTKASHIANVSSLFGLVAPAGQSAYASSKFAVRGFSDAIRMELKPYDIGITTIYPAGVKTNIAKNSVQGAGIDAKKAAANNTHFEKLLKMTPERAAEIIVSGIERKKNRVMVGGVATLFDRIARLLPGSYGGLVAWFMK